MNLMHGNLFLRDVSERVGFNKHLEETLRNSIQWYFSFRIPLLNLNVRTSHIKELITEKYMKDCDYG